MNRSFYPLDRELMGIQKSGKFYNRAICGLIISGLRTG
jgi:hypothetical protein